MAGVFWDPWEIRTEYAFLTPLSHLDESWRKTDNSMDRSFRVQSIKDVFNIVKFLTRCMLFYNHAPSPVL